MFGEENL